MRVAQPAPPSSLHQVLPWRRPVQQSNRILAVITYVQTRFAQNRPLPAPPCLPIRFCEKLTKVGPEIPVSTDILAIAFRARHRRRGRNQDARDVYLNTKWTAIQKRGWR